MTTLVSRAEADAVEARIALLEQRTGVQVVTTIVGKSDAYPEIPWTAFGLGVSAAALAVGVIDVIRPSWTTSALVWSHLVATLAIGAVCAFLAIFVPACGRWFLRDARAAAEVRQTAEAHFLSRGLFGTPERTGLLVFVSVYERRVVLRPDVGLAQRVGGDAWESVIARMAPLLRAGQPAAALQEGLAGIEALLIERGLRGHGQARNLFPDRPTEL